MHQGGRHYKMNRNMARLTESKVVSVSLPWDEVRTPQNCGSTRTRGSILRHIRRSTSFTVDHKFAPKPAPILCHKTCKNMYSQSKFCTIYFVQFQQLDTSKKLKTLLQTALLWTWKTTDENCIISTLRCPLCHGLDASDIVNNLLDQIHEPLTSWILSLQLLLDGFEQAGNGVTICFSISHILVPQGGFKQCVSLQNANPHG